MTDRKGNIDNLTSFKDITADKQRKIASMGGKASVIARREKREQKEALKWLLDDLTEKEYKKLISEGKKSEGKQLLEAGFLAVQKFKILFQAIADGKTELANKIVEEISDRVDGKPIQRQDIDILDITPRDIKIIRPDKEK